MGGNSDDDKKPQSVLERIRKDTEYARSRMEAAAAILDDTLATFEILTDEYKARIMPKDREFRDALNMVSKAKLHLYQEQMNYEKSVLANEGLLADAPLDLDAIRSEIGSKLDRLRDTR